MENLREIFILASFEEGYGTYASPYTKKHHDFSFMMEAEYQLMPSKKSWWNNTFLKMAYGMDFGKILGGINYGFQISFTKKGLF